MVKVLLWTVKGPGFKPWFSHQSIVVCCGNNVMGGHRGFAFVIFEQVAVCKVYGRFANCFGFRAGGFGELECMLTTVFSLCFLEGWQGRVQAVPPQLYSGCMPGIIIMSHGPGPLRPNMKLLVSFSQHLLYSDQSTR